MGHPIEADLVASVLGADYQERHVNLIPQMRARLQSAGVPFVIENVAGARQELQWPALLCGTMFDLKVYRHRYFEIYPRSLAKHCQLPHRPHFDNCAGVGRGLSKRGFVSVTGEGGFGIPDGFNYACAAMGIDWMSRLELSQAIPPAYTEFIGRRLMEYLNDV